MVRRLEDLCLKCVSVNLKRYSGARLKRCLSIEQREVLLQRMASHCLLTPDMMPAVTYHVFSLALRKVTMADSEQVNDNFITQLGITCPNLLHLSLENCKSATDVGLKGLLCRQRKLIFLELRSMSRSLSGSFLSSLHCSASLKAVSLLNTQHIAHDAIVALVTNNPAIEQLCLKNSAHIDDSTVEIIAEKLNSNLRSLNLSRIRDVQTPSLLALAAHCPNLENLWIDNNNHITGEGLPELLASTKLLGLDLSCCFSISTGYLHNMYKLSEKCRQLETLTFPSLTPLPSVLAGLSVLTGLRSLDLQGLVASDNDIEEVCCALGHQLRVLKLDCCPELTDRSCRSLSEHCMVLEDLGMAIHSSLTFEGLLPLLCDPDRARRVKRLSFGGGRELKASVAVQFASSCCSLESLDVSGCSVIDDEVCHLLGENCPHLSYLGLKRCPQITDAGLLSLVFKCPLRMLTASGCPKLTDRSMMRLAEHCENIEELYISGNNSITSAVTAYIEDMGLCKVYVRHRVPSMPTGLLMAKNLDTGRYERVDNQVGLGQ